MNNLVFPSLLELVETWLRVWYKGSVVVVFIGRGCHYKKYIQNRFGVDMGEYDLCGNRIFICKTDSLEAAVKIQNETEKNNPYSFIFTGQRILVRGE